MKKIIKSKLFWVFVTIILIGGGVVYVMFFNNKSGTEYVTEKVIKGDITQSVSATGKVKSASEIELNFKNGGKLSVLNVKVGEKVKADQILAQLRANDLLINVNRATADLDEAITNLNKLKAGSTSQDIAVYEAAVSKAQSDLANAEIELKNTESTFNQAIKNEVQNSMNDINTILTKLNMSIQEVYDTFYYEGDRDNFKTSMPGSETNIMNVQYDDVVNKIDGAQLAYGIVTIDQSESNIDNALDKTSVALSACGKILNDLGELLNYVIITSTMTRTDLDTLKASINAERTTNDSSISTIQSAKHDLEDSRLSYETKVDSAKNAVITAEKNLEKAQADLNLKKSPARSEDIALYEARVKKARADLDLARERYEETIIRSPIAGVITDIDSRVGEQTSITKPIIKMLADENYEVEVNIPESDIVKLNVGDIADITFDAFSENDKFTGVVTTINPAQTEIQDVIYYRVTVALSMQQPTESASLSEKIKPGMTANVTIKTEEAKDVLIIPLRAVKDNDDIKTAEILENGQPIIKQVILGLKGDEGLVEIKSGLEEGNDIITFVREKK